MAMQLIFCRGSYTATVVWLPDWFSCLYERDNNGFSAQLSGFLISGSVLSEVFSFQTEWLLSRRSTRSICSSKPRMKRKWKRQNRLTGLRRLAVAGGKQTGAVRGLSVPSIGFVSVSVATLHQIAKAESIKINKDPHF